MGIKYISPCRQNMQKTAVCDIAAIDMLTWFLGFYGFGREPDTIKSSPTYGDLEGSRILKVFQQTSFS